MRTRSWKLLAVGAAAVLTLGLGACGDDDDDAGTDTGTGTGTGAETDTGTDTGDDGDSAAGGATVTIAGSAFDPSELSVGAGEAIAVTNEDGFAHTFTSDDGGFDVELGGGDSGEATAPSDPGTYEFRCEIHSFMTGTLTVA